MFSLIKQKIVSLLLLFYSAKLKKSIIAPAPAPYTAPSSLDRIDVVLSRDSLTGSAILTLGNIAIWASP